MKKYKLIVKTDYEDKIISEENGSLNIVYDSFSLAMSSVSIELREYIDIEDDNETGELIATITGLYFNLDFILNEELSLFEVFDSYSQDTYELYKALFEDDDYKDEFDVFYRNLFYLDDIYVEPKYRQEGYATMLIEKLFEILNYHGKLNVGVIATMMYYYDRLDEFEGIKDLSNNDKKKLIRNMKDVFVNNGYVVASENNNVLVREFY